MRQNLFYAIVLLSCVAAIALRAVYRDVVESLFDQVKITLGWGYLGLVFALVVTFALGLAGGYLALLLGWVLWGFRKNRFDPPNAFGPP